MEIKKIQDAKNKLLETMARSLGYQKQIRWDIIESVDTNYINTHIKKAIDNYNALGTATFIVAYVKSANYQQFWERYIEHLKAYKYDLDVKRTLVVKPHPNAATRIATTILSRDGFDFPVYFIAFKIE